MQGGRMRGSRWPVVLVCLLACGSSAAWGQPQFPDLKGQWITGKYSSTFGELEIAYLSARDVRGKYQPQYEGEIFGIVAWPDGKLIGHWSGTRSEERCDSERNGTFYWGKVALTFSRETNSFTGVWGNCHAMPTKTWVGQRSHYLPNSFARELAVVQGENRRERERRIREQLAETRRLKHEFDALRSQLKFPTLAAIDKSYGARLDGVQNYLSREMEQAAIARYSSNTEAERTAALALLERHLTAMRERASIRDEWNRQKALYFDVRHAEHRWWQSRQADPDYVPTFTTRNYPAVADDPERLLDIILSGGR